MKLQFDSSPYGLISSFALTVSLWVEQLLSTKCNSSYSQEGSRFLVDECNIVVAVNKARKT